MWLNELQELVHDLERRINEHGSRLRNNEATTRYALIDPLLSKLGWDLTNPSQVQMEFSIPVFDDATGEKKNWRADYAMWTTPLGRPCLIVEAKSLGTKLAAGLHQSINYCTQEGINHFVVTNGQEWEGYAVHIGVPLSEKRVFKFNLADIGRSGVLPLLWLWPGNFSGNRAEPVPIHRVDPADKHDEMFEARSETLDSLPPVPPSPSAELTLNDYGDIEGGWPAPSHLRFPDGQTERIRAWVDLQVATVKWLVRVGRLTPNDCPLANAKGTHLVRTDPRQGKGKTGGFRTPKAAGASLWIGGSCNAASHVQKAKEILEERGQNPKRATMVF